MTPDPLTDGIVADRLRAGVDAMRDAVARTALRGADRWTGPFPGLVATLERLGGVDLCLARLVEGHADAVRIHDQAGSRPREGVYGVWASRSAGTGVRAVREDGGWRLRGECRFASGIDIIDRALLPGWVDDRTHLLFDVAATEVAADRSTWHTPAMDASRSFTVSVDLWASDADVVGPPGFYLDRRGFPVGGLGVAAVWAGGGRSVLEQVVGGLRRFSPTAHQLRRLGVMEQAVRLARTAVDATARTLPDLSGDRLATETAWARTAVVAACDRVVDEATRIVGPGGLSGGPRLSRTLADLTIYVRQHHVDLALEALGRDALASREVLG
jgi:alkylation response protein AidB-like acyl-CoA dehydrogenase